MQHFWAVETFIVTQDTVHCCLTKHCHFLGPPPQSTRVYHLTVLPLTGALNTIVLLPRYIWRETQAQTTTCQMCSLKILRSQQSRKMCTCHREFIQYRMRWYYDDDDDDDDMILLHFKSNYLNYTVHVRFVDWQKKKHITSTIICMLEMKKWIRCIN